MTSLSTKSKQHRYVLNEETKDGGLCNQWKIDAFRLFGSSLSILSKKFKQILFKQMQVKL
jgi:hypothetical protein